MKIFDDYSTVFRRQAEAVAFINGSRKYPEIQGVVFFYSMCDGVVISAEIVGLPGGDGPCDSPVYAFHIHSGTQCIDQNSEAFASAGGHFNPNNCPHPYHAGDMPPLFSAGGKAFLSFLTNRFKLSEILGKTVVIHGKPDDFVTQPAGNAGERIACGVITSTAI